MSKKGRQHDAKFMKCQVKKIDIDKWYEGLRTHRDPSSEYIFSWVKENAQSYRDQWFNSKCISCPNWETCGWKAAEQCQEKEDVLRHIMIDIFDKQYNQQTTVGDFNTGCKEHTIHFFLSRHERGKVIMQLVREEGPYSELIKNVLKTYKCIYVILGIPLLTSVEEQNELAIIEYLEENKEWI